MARTATALLYFRPPRSISSASTWDDDTGASTSPGQASPTVAGRLTGHSCSRWQSLYRSGMGAAPRGRPMLPVVAQDRSAGRQAKTWTGSLVWTFGQMRVLVRWMVGKGYSRLSQLDADAATRFMTVLRSAPAATAKRCHLAPGPGICHVGPADAQREKLLDGVPDDLRRFLEEYRPRIAASIGRGGASPIRQTRLQRHWSAAPSADPHAG